MKSLMNDVAAFHRACDVPILYAPAIPSADRVALRIDLIDEEVNRELIPAMRAGNLVGIADGGIDAIYVIVGMLLDYGIPAVLAWDVVHRANMAKVDPKTGHVRRRIDGKILKPDGWQAPNIAGLLAP